MVNINLFTIEKHRYSGYAQRCFVCMKSENLLRCKRCRLVQYCSKEHQLRHLKTHKAFCKAVANWLNQIRDKSCKVMFENAGKDFDVISCGLVRNLQYDLKRILTYEERSLVRAPLICNACFNGGDVSVVCETCRVVTYCSSQHQAQDQTRHARVCEAYKMCAEYDECCYNQLFISGRVKDVKTLPIDMQQFAKESIEISTRPSGKEKYAVWHISNLMSMPLTIIYVIEKTGLMKNLKDRLAIEIFNPTWTEMNAWWTWEYIFHYFDALKIIDLTFVIPERKSKGLNCVPLITLFCEDCRRTKELRFMVTCSNMEQCPNSNTNQCPNNNTNQCPNSNTKQCPSSNTNQCPNSNTNQCPNCNTEQCPNIAKPDIMFSFNGFEENCYYKCEDTDMLKYVARFKKTFRTLFVLTSFGYLEPFNLGYSFFEMSKQLFAGINPYRSMIIEPHRRFQFNIDSCSNNYITVFTT